MQEGSDVVLLAYNPQNTKCNRKFSIQRKKKGSEKFGRDHLFTSIEIRSLRVLTSQTIFRSKKFEIELEFPFEQNKCQRKIIEEA